MTGQKKSVHTKQGGGKSDGGDGGATSLELLFGVGCTSEVPSATK